MSTSQRGSGSVKYVPTRKWRRFGKSSFRNARSFSKRLNHLFGKRNSYSLLNSKNKKNSFELINFCEGVHVAPLTVPGPGQAQVWGVRNCFTKSAAEDLQFDLDLDQPSDCKAPKEDMRNHKFDALGSLKDSGIATSGDSESDEKRADVDKESEGAERETDSRNSLYLGAEASNIPGVVLRDRLQSFGSSQCYSDSLSRSRGCSYSSSPQEPSISDDFTSIESLDSMDTSYWDLPIMESYDSHSMSYSPRNRRYSESMVRDPRMADGSPQMRMLLANRRMSESWAIRTGNLYRSLDRNPNRRHSLSVNKTSRRGSDATDSITKACTVISAQADDHEDEHENINEDPSNINREQNKTGDSSNMLPANSNRTSDTSDREPAPNQPPTSHLSVEKRSMLHRSRSADSRTLQRPRKNFRRTLSVLGRRATFSDIESSDESACQPSINSSDETDSPRMRGRNGKARTLPGRKSDGTRMRRNCGRFESRQARQNITDSVNGKQESGSENTFEFMPVKNLMFCSGEHGKLASGDDDMNKVIEAVKVEAEKSENTEKDMMVMFLVGKIILLPCHTHPPWENVMLPGRLYEGIG